MSVTQRWPGGITQRYLAAAPQSSGWGETLVANRYRLESAPLGAGSGEGEVFRAWDVSNAQHVALKLYHLRVAPKPAVIERLRGLRHPHLVTLLDAGEWQGHFYEVMVLCEGDTLQAHAPFTPTVLTTFLPALAHALAACHQHGIIHRDLKPTNLYFRDLARTQVVIGDFGISSVLDLPTGRTENQAALTLDYAAPELLEQGAISTKTDYYALGITLLHLLLGQSPFQGLNQAAILAAHLRNRIPLPPTLPLEWRTLIQGLTQFSAAARWGEAQLAAWLSGAVVLDATGQPWTAANFSQCRPYPGYPAAQSPQQLAQHLHQFDALTQLQRGDIRRWVFDQVDPALAEAIGALETEATRHPQLALQRLGWLLNPSDGLRIAGVQLRTLNDLAQLLQDLRPEVQTALAEAFWGELLDAWISHHQLSPRYQALLAQMQALRQRLRLEQNRRRALVALRFLLDPQAQLMLTPVRPLPRLDALEALLGSDPALHQAFTQLLAQGDLEEWLHATQPQADTLRQFIRQARTDYLDQPELAAYIVRWHLDNRSPLPFQGLAIRHPRDLATVIDAHPRATAHGVALLRLGWLRAWLVHTRRLADPAALDALLAQDQPWEVKLEVLLHLLNPELAWPRLEVMPQRWALGTLDVAQTLTCIIQNRSRGYLHGIVQAQTPDLRLDAAVFVGTGSVLRLEVDPSQARQTGAQRTGITLRSNGGTVFLPIRYHITPVTLTWMPGGAETVQTIGAMLRSISIARVRRSNTVGQRFFWVALLFTVFLLLSLMGR